MSTIKKPSSIGETRQDVSIHPPEEGVHPLVYKQRCTDVWMLIFAFRIINALVVRTFFQPDEYFQSLEPAWQMAFGSESGAWITWEWEYQLRSSLHPALFAGVYYVADKIMYSVSCLPQFRAMILSVLPNLVQALFASGVDYHTWQLADRIYGKGSNAGWAVLLMTLFSPWNWFCSTRTFSNCLETELTIEALDYFPWELLSSESTKPSDKTKGKSTASPSTKSSIFADSKSVSSLRLSLLLAALACILRPTNALIWFTIFMPVVLRIFSSNTRLSTSDYLIILREVILCGSAIIFVSASSDRIYFGEWTFPPYQWLNFNISQDLAVFYGKNDWHYHVSQGLPLLLTTYLPFALAGLWQTSCLPQSSIQSHLLMVVFETIFVLSLVSHKEVRFIYPLLPLLHIIAAPCISAFFTTTSTEEHTTSNSSTPTVTKTTTLIRKPLLAILLLLNIFIGGFFTIRHQRGVISVLSYLRHEYENIHLDAHGQLLPPSTNPNAPNPNETFAAFLMPCHSTPWRSQLFYPTLKAWALTCDPPLHLAAKTAERLAYRDEADRFYDNTQKFLTEEVGGRERAWPRYIVGFQGIEEDLRKWYEGKFKGFVMREKWRTGNTGWIDDSRRVGDVVVWEFVDGST